MFASEMMQLPLKNYQRFISNVSDKYNELSKQREDLWKKCQRTDSKKKEAELIEQVRKLDNQINGFYLLDEWKEDVYV